MNLNDEDLLKLTKLTSQHIERVTCAVCCKYYIAPETASCGHTLCHTCWCGQLKCVNCAKPIERRTRQHNGEIQQRTENVHAFSDAFEKVNNLKLAEVLMEVDSENDSVKNVRDWLANSQNHFSGPDQNSERLSHETALPNPLNVSSNKIQIHTNISKAKNRSLEKAMKVIYVPNIPQDDWEKIEPMPDTEDVRKDKENVVGPMDIEPFYIDDENEYTVSNPRRSSRKRELKPDEKNDKIYENRSLEKQNFKDSCEEINKKYKAKQNWINVKKMKKEFSKLHKENKNKLNVSIEMCKKTQHSTKTLDVLPQTATFHYDIDENTPDNSHNKEISKDHNINLGNKDPKTKSLSYCSTNINANNENQTTTTPKNSNQGPVHDKNISKTRNGATQETIHSSHHGGTDAHVNSKNTNKLPFYKRSSLHPKCSEEDTNETTKAIKTTHHNVVVHSNTNANEDIEITIKVANAIANILIKRNNDMEIKINTDCGVQTSLDPHDINGKTNSSKNTQAQSIISKVGENHEVRLNHQEITNPKVDELKKIAISCKTGSEKKNTDSADTATAQFEITESVEKELSKVMDFEDIDKQIQSQSTPTVGNEKSSEGNKTQTSAAHPADLEYINDLDIFDSESVKESDVKLLKNTKNAPSEILLCTVKTKNKTQNVTEKRRKSNEDSLPKSKKAKINNDIHELKQNQPESESMTYDAISQTVIKNTYPLKDNNTKISLENCTKTHTDKDSQEVVLPRSLDISQSSQIINNFINQKDSENVFSIGVEKKHENVETAPITSINKKMPSNLPPSNIEDFLTPVLSQAADSDVQNMNYDSDKSVVEETPQKNSFTKIKQKSNGANKEGNQSQRTENKGEVSSKKNTIESGNKESIINLSDSSEIKSSVNVTAITAAAKRSTGTPLTINKFFDNIHHNSTPLAKKSLNFDSEIVDDLTLCTTNDVVAKTTQEREFMIKAFENTPTAPAVPAVKLQSLRSLVLKHKKCVIAGTSLTYAKIANLKELCARNKWSYVDKYTKDLTHLVVGVNEENKAQRTIKYMCALASSIWIVSYEWVEKCIQSKDLVNEEPYEVLDSTGHPGPMRSRTASKKVLQGISFFCMEPFSILDVVSLKVMIEAAGGRVVEEVKEVQVTDTTSAPAILLAEPENTQEDRFIYLTMKLKIVPVNYEWVLNCLGSYTLTSFQSLLLCPAALLPKAVEKWPQELLAHDDDDE